MNLNENFLFFLHFFTNLWEILGHRDFWVLALKAKVNRWLIKKIDTETSFEEKEKILLKYSYRSTLLTQLTTFSILIRGTKCSNDFERFNLGLKNPFSYVVNSSPEGWCKVLPEGIHLGGTVFLTLRRYIYICSDGTIKLSTTLQKY